MDKPRTVRSAMPKVMAFIDDLRAAFGADDINALIKAGQAGVPVFWAREGGHEIGTRYQERGTEVGAAQMVLLPPEKAPDAPNRNPRR